MCQSQPPNYFLDLHFFQQVAGVIKYTVILISMFAVRSRKSILEELLIYMID